MDLGSGTGWLTAILNEIGPSTGVELSENTITASKKKYPSVEFIAGNFFEVDIQEKQYDIVISQEVIEHVDDQNAYLEIAFNSLKKGGYLILTTPNAHNFNHWTNKALDDWNLQPVENWMTINELKNLLLNKFRILKTKTVIAKFGSKGLIYKLLSSSKVNRVLESLRIKNFKDDSALSIGLGLHIVVLAQKQ
ncbi:MAG: class I SAM-dependent methyltransferase [bacterium]